MNNASERERWLALHHSLESRRQLPALLAHYGDVRSLCESYRPKNGKTPAQLLDDPDERYQKDWRWSQQTGHKLIAYGDPDYPPALRELPTPPVVLFALGDVSLLSEPQLTVVGSRRPSLAGLENAKTLSRELAQAGLVISSGLAAGIDTAAHLETLAVKAPTIAVVGTGLDLVYPARNKALAQDIAAQGLLISEFSCGMPPLAPNFPQRNRLMAALSLGVLVIEATNRSGSLITARLASEYGREVFAVPGSIRNPCASGCHRLIRDGAHLVESAHDVLLVLSPELQRLTEKTDRPPNERRDKKPSARQEALSPDHRHLLDNMAYDEPAAVDELVERSGLTAAEVSSMLLILELEGWVRSEHHLYARIK